eukprot:Blabericola_migrator_1__13367@NODE_949_length_5910_cov_490_869416_g659_i0_p1_GENE_NODE_949_length_5910_cov_490_869416_g659_i0NODE_949_length_5910_cov_490_869416_g659_i0_p1_ORF_typecomplete_len1832_score345_00POR_N/PF01855_19/1_5e51FAD_binding_1/PF00667_20/5_8e03FAD_binding_1/PF00667_20/7_1e48POR/PF01558_18/1_4e40Flavodoxin_1/PF00258_25/1_3e32PFOR_II/PF17147_4/4_5e26NAD_binding_1/PF00175_21/4_5e03NAD_binding_1/PF00175_21/3_4e15TPP_enzyme_C/PF02775_21/4_5e14Fer4_16/PF13484_6/3_6e13EKR/PF10371_9/5_
MLDVQAIENPSTRIEDVPRMPNLPDETVAKLLKYPKEDVVDGCTAAAHVAYACTDASFIYPITPSTPMAEIYDVWSGQGRLNVFGQVATVRELQSEAGAAGAVHGSLSAGALTTTFTASQGLLLMIPPMYKIAGELLPCVFHVSARAVAGQALSIFGDHSDVMAVRQCGWALLCGCSVQEAQDLAMIAHMATLESKVPFVHFFDGFRTSHELQKISLLNYMQIRRLLNYQAIEEFKHHCLNPTRPYTKGTSQGPEVYFQNVELANKYYQDCPKYVRSAMDKFAAVSGREYHFFSYYGSPEAEDIIVVMGSAAQIVEEAIDYMRANGRENVGSITVRLYRPWVADDFLAALPATCKRICVLDRVKEPGALGEPLFLDVAATIQRTSMSQMKIIGGRYGLGSRDFTPAMVLAIYDNLQSEASTHSFTVGIHDDVTHLSLDYSKYLRIDCVPAGTTQCMFWGMGSDGTVGANKNVIKILGQNTPLKVQGYFAYSAHKAGGLTVSHLRFGPHQIKSSYFLQACDYIAVHRPVYLQRYDCLLKIKNGGTFVLNTDQTDEELEATLPGNVKRRIAENHVKFYAIDANKVAAENGMGRRINNVLMTSFFKVSGVLPFEEAISLFKEAIKKTYGKKGMHVVEANWKCVDAAVSATREIPYDHDAWSNAPLTAYQKEMVTSKAFAEPPAFVANILAALETSAGEDLPLSTFAPHVGGKIPPGTAGFEKRAIALNVPIVDMDKCTQCNQCSFVCPHAAIRPFLLDDDEAEKAPSTFVSRKVKGVPSLASYKYRIQVAPYDCTGCSLCVMACKDDALTMIPLGQAEHVEHENWKFAITTRDKSDELETKERANLKGSQFYTPLMEFSGACEGCGETPYVKLLTQLFGERLIIANATGCSSIWGASYPANAYTVNQKGYGPAWANSLFEDNAEFGFGMAIATAQRRLRLRSNIERALSTDSVASIMSEQLRSILAGWLLTFDDAALCQKAFEDARDLLTEESTKHQLIADIDVDKDLLPKMSQWIIGGDGWAYDIGYGGLDHVVASGVDVNFLVLDTEVYSNTGGQCSKATPMGAVHKFASTGKTTYKKDLGAMCMDYGNVYVASIASSANMAQTVRAFVEAESYTGVSVIMAYSPCIEHQYLKPFNTQIEHSTQAVESGYWPLYRNDPRLVEKGLPSLQLDSKKIKADIVDLIRKENRFAILRRTNPKLADELEGKLREWAKDRLESLKGRAAGRLALQGTTEADPEKVYHILFGTDTGNTENLASVVSKNIESRGLKAPVSSLSDVTVDDIAGMRNVLVICSTAGQGAYPPNARDIAKELEVIAKDNHHLFHEVRYAVMGLGDSSYVFFNQAAKNLDSLFEALGGQRLVPVGLGDDQADGGYDAAYQDWVSELLAEIKAPAPVDANDDPLPNAFTVTVVEPPAESERMRPVHDQFQYITLNSNIRMTPSDYEVDIRHMNFDLTGTGLKYALGDSLAIIPTNMHQGVEDACTYLGLIPDQWIKITPKMNSVPVKYATTFQRPMTVKTLLTDCLCLFGKPSRYFYENIYRYATDATEKETLKHLLDKENKTLLIKLSHETVNYMDVIMMYPSIRLSLEQLIDIIPLLRPRYYSIASSQKFVGENNLELCVGVVQWTKPERKIVGPWTSQLTGQMKTQYGSLTGNLPLMVGGMWKVQGAIKPTAFNLPPTDKHPIIVAGMGTGIAPFRSFIQYRALLARQGKEIGPLSVYFGCRYSAKDCLFREEMEAYKTHGIITELELAFSRDQKEKDYIQHHIVKNGANFYQRMVTEDGYFYLCGSAKQVPIDVRRAVRTVLMEHGNMTEEDAEKTVTHWQVIGKYNVEAW